MRERVEGAGAKKRPLRDTPLDERVKAYGMSTDLRDTLLRGYLRQRKDIANARLWREALDNPNLISRVAQPGWKRLTNPTISGTKNLKRYPGYPDEFWMNPDAYADMVGASWLIEQVSSGGLLKGLFWHGIKNWKAFKTAMAPGTHATNMFGNALVQSHIHI